MTGSSVAIPVRTIASPTPPPPSGVPNLLRYEFDSYLVTGLAMNVPNGLYPANLQEMCIFSGMGLPSGEYLCNYSVELILLPGVTSVNVGVRVNVYKGPGGTHDLFLAAIEDVRNYVNSEGFATPDQDVHRLSGNFRMSLGDSFANYKMQVEAVASEALRVKVKRCEWHVFKHISGE